MLVAVATAPALATPAVAAGAEVDEAAGPIVLYDGVCGLCARSVRWLLKRDHQRRLRFAPLQGPTAAALRLRYPRIPTSLTSVVLVEAGRVDLRSKVFLRAARHLRWPWRALGALAWLPGWLLDPGYLLVARVRYRVWGKFDTCQVPDPAARSQLLP
ncbi:MAG: DUF393 domain-containing protein [Kofleriaceae bacterium]|jgi:predicted DCC family thiol-disulfide oxidoreductase YuxK|nr:DUF393 domain-containing protein [Kofleriaceae bacterium]MBP9203640.1 DUF393 domain-containing protein [Kofleriaceae bacterium]